MAKNANLTLSERIIIESCLRDGMSFKQIAREVVRIRRLSPKRYGVTTRS